MHCTYASDWMDVFLGLLWMTKNFAHNKKEEGDRGEAKAERRRQHEAWGVHSFRVEYGVRLLA